MPVVAPHELIAWVETLGLNPSPDAAASLGKHPGARSHAQPMFLYGDDAEYTKYCDKLLGVYIGALCFCKRAFL